MPDNIINTRIKLATKSDSDWSTLNPTLLSGEVGLDSTNKLIYVGDGTTAFNSLTAWNLLPTNLVTTDTNQNITGTKTFVGTKKIAFKQSGSSDKLGFTLYNSGETEKGYLEYNPTNLIDGYPLMTIGNYATSSAGLTQVGFRRYSGISGASGAYNLLTPLIADARTPFSLTTTYTNFYLPLGFTDGTTTVKTAKSGIVDLSSLIPSSSLPSVTSSDNGKFLGVSSGAWSVLDIPKELPEVTATNDGKVLGVVSGAWGLSNEVRLSVSDYTTTAVHLQSGSVRLRPSAGTYTSQTIYEPKIELRGEYGTTNSEYGNYYNVKMGAQSGILIEDGPMPANHSDTYHSIKVTSREILVNNTNILGKLLPSVTSSDSGKILTVSSSGYWNARDVLSGYLPLSGGTIQGDVKFQGNVIKHDSLKNIDVDLVNAYEPLVAYGTNILANSNLNTTPFVNVGLYYVEQNATASTLTNCPTIYAFTMVVKNITKSFTDTQSRTYQYVVREITVINGDKYIQRAYCEGTVGSWTFGNWYMVNQSLASEGDNTAGWLKAMVGRQSSIDFPHIYDGEMVHARLDIVPSSLSPNPFGTDGYLLTFMWDNSGAWDTQLFIPNNSAKGLQYRFKGNSSWGNEINLVGKESGSTTVDGVTWTWDKYDDGYVDMYADITLNGTWQSWGSMYVLEPKTTYALPITITKKLADVTTYRDTDGSANSALPTTYSTTSDNNKTTCALLRPTVGNNNTNYYCRKYIKGEI